MPDVEVKDNGLIPVGDAPEPAEMKKAEPSALALEVANTVISELRKGQSLPPGGPSQTMRETLECALKNHKERAEKIQIVLDSMDQNPQTALAIESLQGGLW